MVFTAAIVAARQQMLLLCTSWFVAGTYSLHRLLYAGGYCYVVVGVTGTLCVHIFSNVGLEAEVLSDRNGVFVVILAPTTNSGYASFLLPIKWQNLQLKFKRVFA